MEKNSDKTKNKHNVIYGKMDGTPKQGKNSLEGALIENTTLTNSRLIQCNMRTVDFFSSSLFGTNAISTYFDQSHFRNIDLANTPSLPGIYADCSFTGCIFESTIITNTEFYDCDFTRTIIKKSELDSVYIGINTKSKTDFEFKNKNYMTFIECNIRNFRLDCKKFINSVKSNKYKC